MSVLLSIAKLDTFCRDADYGWFGNYKCIDSPHDHGDPLFPNF